MLGAGSQGQVCLCKYEDTQGQEPPEDSHFVVKILENSQQAWETADCFAVREQNIRNEIAVLVSFPLTQLSLRLLARSLSDLLTC